MCFPGHTGLQEFRQQQCIGMCQRLIMVQYLDGGCIDILAYAGYGSFLDDHRSGVSKRSIRYDNPCAILYEGSTMWVVDPSL